MKKAIRVLLVIFGGLFVLFIILNVWVVQSTSDRVYEKIDEVPEYDVALVLGTSKYVVEGGLNDYWHHRLQAAFELHKIGKIKHIIVSGDNETVYYNEPKTMKDGLVDMGVPESDITMDYAGFRTLDSIVRCKEVFGQDRFIIVTQSFHNYRAVFIGNYYNLDVVGFAAAGGQSPNRFMVYIRECLARILAVFDLYIMDTSPKFLGDKEPLLIK